MENNSQSLYVSKIHRIFEERFNPDEEYLGVKKPVNGIKPLLSVIVATYQHAPFIRQCLDSILMQKTSFPFEILLGEDESSDGTREICKEYAEKYPDKIRLFLRDRTTSHYVDKETDIKYRFNVKWLRKSSRGKYVAVCEGDDYWTDPYKLKKQVEFLENNEEYILTVGGYEILDSKTGQMKKVIKRVNQNDSEHKFGYTFTLNEASKKWITKTLTLVFRNLNKVYPKMYQYSYSRDVHFIYHLLQEGKGFYFTEIFGVYRLHEGGIYSPKSSREKALIRFKISKEIYLVNNEEHSRIMYFLAISNILKKHSYLIENGDIKHSKPGMFIELLKATRNIGEFKTLIKTLLYSLLFGAKNK